MSYFDNLKMVPGDAVDLSNKVCTAAVGQVTDKMTEGAAKMADETLGTDVIAPTVKAINTVGQISTGVGIARSAAKLARHLTP